MGLTRKQIKTYIDHEGCQCPFCESVNISSMEHPYTLKKDNEVSGPIEYCPDCKRFWKSMYKLHGAIPYGL